MRRQCCIHSAIFLIIPSIGIAEPRPPEPNPAAPVDYMAWIYETFEKDRQREGCGEFEKALAELTLFDADWGGSLTHPWSQNENPPVASWLDKNRNALAAFRMSAETAGCSPVGKPVEPTGDDRIDQWLVLAELRSLRPHRDAVKGLVAEGWRAWVGDGGDRLIRNCAAALEAVHQRYRDPVLISRLVGIVGAATVYEAMGRALHASKGRDQMAAQLASVLADTDPPIPSLAALFELERVNAWDVCQRLFVPGEGSSWTIHGPLFQAFNQAMGASLRERDKRTMAKIGFERTLKEINGFYDGVAEWMNTPYYGTGDAGERDQKRVEMFEHIPRDSRNPLIQRILPSFATTRRLHEQITALRRGTHLLVQIMVHRGKHGKFPQSLDELATPELSRIRLDPFSGKDLVYQRRGRRFRLYSVSNNLVDDGGKHGSKLQTGDYVFWPPPK